MTARHRIWSALVAGALLAATALATVGAPPAGAASTPLEDTNWVLTSRSSFGTGLGSVTVTIQFAGDGTLSGNNGCNNYGSTYATRRNRMIIADRIFADQRLCAGREDVVGGKYLAALPKVRTFAISGTTLTLRGRGGVTLVYRATGARDLVGKWEVTSFYTGNAVSSPVTGSTLTAEFTRRQISGSSGCNTYSGPYTATATTIEIGPLASTLRACADPATTQQEQEFLAALALATSYRVAGDRLDLLRDGGTIAATLTRAS
jgi:heat shock protein HslJ